jgi:two-component system NarL family response regulator
LITTTDQVPLGVGVTTTVMIVDDHDVLRKGLAVVLEAQPDMTVVAEFATGEAAVESYNALQPHVVLMDLKMSGLSGVDSMEQLRANHPSVRVIVFSNYDRYEDVYRCVKAGAMGYLVKDSSVETILHTIRSVAIGRKFFPPAISEKLANRLTITDLSAKEMDVLKLLARGLSNIEIADSLCVSLSAVKYHINNILGKLNSTDRTQAVVTALRIGLVEL